MVCCDRCQLVLVLVLVISGSIVPSMMMYRRPCWSIKRGFRRRRRRRIHGGQAVCVWISMIGLRIRYGTSVLIWIWIKIRMISS